MKRADKSFSLIKKQQRGEQSQHTLLSPAIISLHAPALTSIHLIKTFPFSICWYDGETTERTAWRLQTDTHYPEKFRNL